MSQKRRIILKNSAIAALHLIQEEESSDESDDDMEELLLKAYFKYKSKRRKITGKKYVTVQSSGVSSSSESDDSPDSDNSGKLDNPKSMDSSGQMLPMSMSDYAELEDAEYDAEPSAFLDTSLEGPIPYYSQTVDAESNQDICSISGASNVGTIAFDYPIILDYYIPPCINNNWTCSADFKNAFKISRTIAEDMMKKIQSKLLGRSGRPSIPIEKSFLMCLWTLATKESFHQMCERFENVGKATFYRAFTITCQQIQELEDYKIKWPTGSDADKVVQDFQFSIPGVSDAFPGTFGCLGATHIRICEHRDKYSGYYNRLNYPSIAVQMVCDSTGRLIDVSPAFKGSCSDSAVWKKSELYARLEADPELLPPDTHLIGHEAYPLSTKLMVPYWPTDGYLTPDQVKYNFILTNRRSLIENVFVKLKQGWQRLQYLVNRHLDDRCSSFVKAACILYNASLDDYEGDVEDYSQMEDTGCAVGQYEDERDEEFEDEEEAIIKRDNIALLCRDL